MAYPIPLCIEIRRGAQDNWDAASTNEGYSDSVTGECQQVQCSLQIEPTLYCRPFIACSN